MYILDTSVTRIHWAECYMLCIVFWSLVLRVRTIKNKIKMYLHINYDNIRCVYYVYDWKPDAA